MSNSMNDGQEQSKNTTTEESNAMTIEFLRARLLSERSISKAARQKADELANRVTELEEQLKHVSLQRKKAEKAMSDVLAILEDRGITDVSEEFDSCSDQDETPSFTEALNGSVAIKETSTDPKTRNDMEAYSSSELESSPSGGRSLSWKGSKDVQHSLEKKRYMDSVRRRASFASNSYLAKRVGKSCRKIRRRETRPTEVSQNGGIEKAGRSRDNSNSSDGVLDALGESTEHYNENNPLANPKLGSNSEIQKINDRCSGSTRHEDMECALRHQAQLIGRYEEEEKAQREWEEKFRENNSGTQDSCDPGNHSDVTEELHESKSTQLGGAAETSDSQERKLELEENGGFSGDPKTSKIVSSLQHAVKRSLQDDKSSSRTACEISGPEFSFPITKENSDHEFPREHHEKLQHMCQPTWTMMHPSSKVSSSPGSSLSYELAVMPQETTNNLGSVLEALERAKLSLNEKLIGSSLVVGGTSSNVIKQSNPKASYGDRFKLPVGPPSLFRLPTDNQFEATTWADHTGIGAQSNFSNFPPELAGGRFLYEPFVESIGTVSVDPFFTTPPRPFDTEIRPGVSPLRSPRLGVAGPSSSNRMDPDPYASSVLTTPLRPFDTEIRHGVYPLRSLSQPRLSAAGPSSSNRMYGDPYTSSVPPPVSNYPFLPDITLHLPLSRETSRSSEVQLPPAMRSPLHDDHVRQYMYR